MKAFFADIKETGLVPDRGREAWGSKLSLPSEEERRQLAELDERLQGLRRDLEGKAQSLAARRAEGEKGILGQYESGHLA